MKLPSFRSAIPFFVLAGLICSGGLALLGRKDAIDWILLVTLIVGSIPLVIDIGSSILRRHFGVDIIAIVAIGTSLLLDQYLAGTVIVLMLSGGEALESFALRRARRELSHLLSNAPTNAHKEEGGKMVDVPVESVVVGDLVIVKVGETIPVDGRIVEGTAMVDESMLTGESIPVRKSKGLTVMSGSVSKDSVLHIEATHDSSQSKYQQIIRLVREAEEQKAPFVRLADRYSVWFTAVTFVLAIVAWIVSGDPVRILAVLVVATPCPLILATPIAFACGISRAAKRGIIIKNGGVLEKLGEARSLVFDKTGTLTFGTPSIVQVSSYGTEKEEDILLLAASLDQLSTHILARSLLQEAATKHLELPYPDNFTEHIGEGVEGTIGGTQYIFGRLALLQTKNIRIPDQAKIEHDDAQKSGRMAVFLADTEKVIGAVFFADTVRGNIQQLFQTLRGLGLERIMMLTGDKRSAALRIAAEVGIHPDDVQAESLPQDKVNTVLSLHKNMPPVVMVGDGVNDAPAIAAADVGIAMGGHGSTASSEAGDIVILIDKIERVGEALVLGHRVLHIAKQSIFIGIGLSIGLMILASLGYIQPVYGAMLQEIVDIVVILNALRVLFEEHHTEQVPAIMPA